MTKLRIMLCTLTALGVGVSRAEKSPETADLVLLNGKIVTLDDSRPEVQALAVRGDRIVAVGSDARIRAYVTRSTRVIDLKGKLAIPGFIEGHGHFLGLGRAKLQLDLAKVETWSGIVQRVQEAARHRPPGEWILGRGWHQEKWKHPPASNIGGWPTHRELSRVSPDHPVMLSHSSGHASIANGRAMQLAGVTRQTTDPDGGRIVRDSRGEPTGVFLETAQDLLQRALEKSSSRRRPEQVEVELRRAVELATAECLAKGVTSFQDAGAPFATIDFYQKLLSEGKLVVRLWVMVDEDNQQLARHLARYRFINRGDNRLTVRAIKRFMDGALGSRGAWLLKPYADAPTSSGLPTTAVSVIEQTAELAIVHDFQLCTHAIGDRANRAVLDIYGRTFQKHHRKRNLRWRIEHAQHLHPDDIGRFAKLGVIASMQGIHCTSDGPWVVERLGEQRARRGAYMWQALIRSGAIVSNGTDTPVENVDPIANFHASVTRRLADGRLFYPEQRMTRMQALRSQTLSVAHAAFEEDIKGSLKPGKLADIVVLSRDILTVAEEQIPTTHVLYTIVGGTVAHKR